MADLFDRLFPAEANTENIPVHYFFAALVDYAAGETTRQQMINYWAMDSEAQADLNALCDHIDGLSGLGAKLTFALELHAVFMFAEAGAKYTSKVDFRTRLGIS